MIQVRNLFKSFGDHSVLRGINLDVRRGKTRVILGLSGSGKTVLMKHVIGLLRPDSGEVRVDGEDITRYDNESMLRLRHRFGMVFQLAALFDSMTVAENVAFPLTEHTKLNREEIAEKVREKLAIVGLEGTEGKYPSELSGGMRKRVGLARAIVLGPTCVLYDEPTTGLDPLSTESIETMIKNASRQLEVTSLVISHDVGSAINVADDIAVLHDGQIIEDCAASELRNSNHPFVQKFLGAWFGKQ